MNRNSGITALFVLAAALTLAPAGRAEDAPAPAKPAAPTSVEAAVEIPNLTGVWILDRAKSDDLSTLRPPGAGGGERGSRGPGGGGMERSRANGGAEGGPPPEGGRPRRMNLQPEQLTVDQRGKRVEFFEGTQLLRTLSWAAEPDTGTVVAAKWQGTTLLAEGKTPWGGTRTESYAIVDGGKTLEVRMSMSGREGEKRELVSRYTKYEGD